MTAFARRTGIRCGSDASTSRASRSPTARAVAVSRIRGPPSVRVHPASAATVSARPPANHRLNGVIASSAVGSSADEAATQGDGHGGGPVADAQLLVDVLEVGLDGRRADDQPVGDFRPAEAVAGQAQDLEFARTQPPRFEL